MRRSFLFVLASFALGVSSADADVADSVRRLREQSQLLVGSDAKTLLAQEWAKYDPRTLERREDACAVSAHWASGSPTIRTPFAAASAVSRSFWKPNGVPSTPPISRQSSGALAIWKRASKMTIKTMSRSSRRRRAAPEGYCSL